MIMAGAVRTNHVFEIRLISALKHLFNQLILSNLKEPQPGIEETAMAPIKLEAERVALVGWLLASRNSCLNQSEDTGQLAIFSNKVLVPKLRGRD